MHPLGRELRREAGIGRRDSDRTSALPFAVSTTHAVDGDELGRPQHDAVGAKRHGLQNVLRTAHAAARHDHHLVADAFLFQEIVHLHDTVFDRLRDILLRDIRRRAGPAVPSVEVNNVRAGIVGSDRDHIHVTRSGNLDRHQHIRPNRAHPVQMFLVILYRIDAVERKRREKTRALHRLAHCRNPRSVLLSEQVSAQSRLRALGIFELDQTRAQNGFLAHPEEARCNLRDDVIGVRNQFIRIPPLPGRRKRAHRLRRRSAAGHHGQRNRSVGHAAAVHRQRNRDLRAASAAVEGN